MGRDILPIGLHTLYSHLLSLSAKHNSTFQQDGQTWSINYADNSWVTGTLGIDDITVAGIPIKGQTFGLASVNSGSTVDAGADGIMGLGFESNSEIGRMYNIESIILLNLCARIRHPWTR